LYNEARVVIISRDAFGKAGEGYAYFSYTTNYELIKEVMERVNGALKRL